MPLQRKATEVLFVQLGIYYVPGLMLGELRRFDVRYAFAVFVERFGLRYGVLTTPGHARYPAQRDALEAIVGFLLEVEECSKDTSLQPTPLYDAVARSIEEAEDLLNTYQQVASVLRSLEGREIEFPKYLEFRVHVRERLQQWHEVSPEELDEIFMINHAYVTLQDRFLALLEQFGACIAWLVANIDRAGEDRELILKMVEEKEVLEAQIRDGSREPDDGVMQLADLLNDITDAAYALGFEEAFSEEGESVGPLTMADYCKILEVSESVTRDELKKAYRKLAMVYHPDHNPGNKEAEERFKEINTAYSALHSFLAVGV
jgi:DnaJ-domain-containing protein 1